jgi:hypothetical protein
MFCGLLRAASFIVKFPVRRPVAVGVKVTLTLQLLPLASLVGQLLVSAKSPVTLTPLMRSGVTPGLVTVTT